MQMLGGKPDEGASDSAFDEEEIPF